MRALALLVEKNSGYNIQEKQYLHLVRAHSRVASARLPLFFVCSDTAEKKRRKEE